jgi:hypothetical protein
MAACPALAKQRGLTELDLAKIEAIHEDCETLLREYKADGFNFLRIKLDMLRNWEYDLQELWGFPLDERYHTRGERLKNIHLQQQWVGRTFECVDSGNRETITKDRVGEGKLFGVGHGFIDFGRAGGYHRIGGKLREVGNVTD